MPLFDSDGPTFTAVDEQGNTVECRAVFGFEKEGNYFFIFAEETDAHHLIAGYCPVEEVSPGSTIVIRPVQSQEHWNIIGEVFTDVLSKFAELASGDLPGELAELFSDLTEEDILPDTDENGLPVIDATDGLLS